MDYLNDINAVPVILGSGKAVFFTAFRIWRTRRIVSHVFSDSFSLPLRLLARCHPVPWGNTDIICRALCDFASALDESAIPILIALPRSPHFCAEQTELINTIYISADSEEIL